MKLKCPACGAENTLEQMTQATELLALAKAQAAFGDDWPLVAEYLDGFRPPSGKALAVKKLLRLAREVWAMWSKGRFQYGREEFQVGREEFKEALAGVANRHLTGLTSHNYLKKALMAAAEKTSRRKERELKDREQGLGVRDQGEGLELPELQGLPDDPDWREKLQKLSWEVRKPGLTVEERAAARQALEEHLCHP